MNRRSFLLGFSAALAAPAVVKAELIMPVRKIITPLELWSPNTLDSSYLKILDELSDKGVPIPHSIYWKTLGSQLAQNISDRMLRDGFMKRILDRSVVDEAHMPRIKMNKDVKVMAVLSNGEAQQF